MTGEELSALIRDEIGEDKRLHGILDRIRDGKANLTDSELYAAITARITAQQMQRNVLSLEKREAAFVDVTRERYRDTFTVYSAVQRILDAQNGIRIRPQEPGFDTGRARKIGHSLEDQTVPDSTIERRARSATENFCMSHHDDCMRANAEFRARAGLQSYAIREGGAKCCDWCADVSGKYPANETPQGFWGRHDNCKCSILYESKRGGRQLLRGTSKKWEQVAPGAGAGELHRMTAEQVAAVGAGAVHRFDFRSKPGKDDSAIANMAYINSDAFADKFKGKYENQAVENAVVAACRKIIRNRNGTHFEEAFFIDAHTGETFSYVKEKHKNGVDMPESLKKRLTNTRKSSIIMIHNHPNSSPLSSNDYATSSEYASLVEVIACGHNGDVYVFRNTYGTAGAIIRYQNGREECETVRDFRIAFSKNKSRLNQEDYEARHNAWLNTAELRGFFYERR